jgi:hypothetical protein
MANKNTRYITIIYPNGDVEQRTSDKEDLCESIQHCLGGYFESVAMSKLVVNDVVMRERVKGRTIYVLEAPRRMPDHQNFSIKGGYYRDGHPSTMTMELHKKWWVDVNRPVQGSLVAVGKKAPYEVPAPAVPQERVATPPIRQVESQVALPEVPAGVDIEPLPVPQRRTWWDIDMATGTRTLRCNADFDKMMMGLIHSADAK